MPEPYGGKSRLAEAQVERIATERHTRLRCFCSPHHRDSTRYPVNAQTDRAADFAHPGGPAAKLAKLQVLLAVTARPIEAVRLKPAAIDSHRLVIRVDQGNGRKDRYVMLPPNCWRYSRS